MLEEGDTHLKINSNDLWNKGTQCTFSCDLSFAPRILNPKAHAPAAFTHHGIRPVGTRWPQTHRTEHTWTPVSVHVDLKVRTFVKCVGGQLKPTGLRRAHHTSHVPICVSVVMCVHAGCAFPLSEWKILLMPAPHPFPLFHPNDCYQSWPTVASNLTNEAHGAERSPHKNQQEGVKVKQACQGPPCHEGRVLCILLEV